MGSSEVSYQKNIDTMAGTGIANGSEEVDEEEAEDTVEMPALNTPRFQRQGSSGRYSWRKFVPSDGSWITFFRWLIVGGGKYAAEQSEEVLYTHLSDLASCISDIRDYLTTYGMPSEGGPKTQEVVLREVVRDLYGGGAPLWALDSVMQKAAEGLTGDSKVNWLILPRKAFVFHPSTMSTAMFKIDRGFNIQKMDAMERVLLRLASFASNTRGMNNIPSRFPNPREFRRAFQAQSSRSLLNQEKETPPAKELAKRILDSASRSQGIFFFINSKEYAQKSDSDVDQFWEISEREQELFTRLATIEAMEMIDIIDANRKALYTREMIVAFRVLASAGACGFWFGGSWIDMMVAGFLAVIVAAIGENPFLSKQEKLIFETLASFIVGLCAGLIALEWDKTCYQAMAIAGVLDILQGFRVVYAIIELMSKHTVAGGADFLEAIIFTGLIAYFLRFGQYFASYIDGDVDDPSKTVFSQCSNGISQYWYILWVPLAAVAWSGLFNPEHRDLIAMGFHGCLAFGVNYGLTKAGSSDNMNNFLSAMAVSLSAGLISRFTGRQAVGNTAAGLYVLLPGAYLVNSITKMDINSNFFTDITMRAVIIGIGAWTGSILCSPTLLGTTRGLLSQQISERPLDREHSAHQPTLLFF